MQIQLSDPKPLSPYLFGQNLEYTRGSITGGLSAQRLRNRKFAGKPSRNEGVCEEWFPIGTDVFYSTTQTAPYTRHFHKNAMLRHNELQSQSVQNYMAGEFAGIGQKNVFLKAGEQLLFRVVVKAGDLVRLEVFLTDDSGKQIYAAHSFAVQAGEYQTFECSFLAPQTDENASLRLVFSESADVTFGAVSLLPGDHFHGMRPDVVALLKRVGTSFLRWPGGNFAGEYRWKDMFLPVDERGPLQSHMENETQTYSQGYDLHEIDTDDYIALCREIGAEPSITVNLQWDSPEICAQWVEYCNGGPETEYGALRAQRGHLEPYHVQYWSLGNEMGFSHMESPDSPSSYAAAARLCAEAMRRVTPELLLTSSGPYPDEKWVEDSALPLSDVAPFVSLHTYMWEPFDFTNPEREEKTFEAMMLVPGRFLEKARELRAQLGEKAWIAYDEWNFWYAWFRPSTAAQGLFAAKMLHMLLEQSIPLRMPIACYFQAVAEGAIEITPKEAFLTADGQAMEMMLAHKGGSLCAVEGTKPLEALATLHGDQIVLSVMNDSYAESREYALKLAAVCEEAVLYSAPRLKPRSSFVVSALPVCAKEEGVTFTLPPHSMARICLKREKNERI